MQVDALCESRVGDDEYRVGFLQKLLDVLILFLSRADDNSAFDVSVVFKSLYDLVPLSVPLAGPRQIVIKEHQHTLVFMLSKYLLSLFEFIFKAVGYCRHKDKFVVALGDCLSLKLFPIIFLGVLFIKYIRIVKGAEFAQYLGHQHLGIRLLRIVVTAMLFGITFERIELSAALYCLRRVYIVQMHSYRFAVDVNRIQDFQRRIRREEIAVVYKSRLAKLIGLAYHYRSQHAVVVCSCDSSQHLLTHVVVVIKKFFARNLLLSERIAVPLAKLSLFLQILMECRFEIVVYLKLLYCCDKLRHCVGSAAYVESVILFFFFIIRRTVLVVFDVKIVWIAALTAYEIPQSEHLVKVARVRRCRKQHTISGIGFFLSHHEH